MAAAISRDTHSLKVNLCLFHLCCSKDVGWLLLLQVEVGQPGVSPQQAHTHLQPHLRENQRYVGVKISYFTFFIII